MFTATGLRVKWALYVKTITNKLGIAMDQWYLDNLVCPADKSPLEYKDGMLISSSGRKYPVIDGVPVMLIDDTEQTMPLVRASLERAKNNPAYIDSRAESLYLESLGISEKEKEGVVQLAANKGLKIDPVASFIIGATNGYAYKDLIGKVNEYPIPDLRLPNGDSKLFLDVGCNWGRWCIAASRKGYTVIGIDPSLGAVMAAKRIANQLGLPIKYIVGDARYLPFRSSLFDQAFSYSVLQHFGKDNAVKALQEIGRALKPGGTSLIQMPNWLGIRSLQHQIKRGFREPVVFEVRYWSIRALNKAFQKAIGDTTVTVDCYFGLGLQKSDMKYMSKKIKVVIGLSEILRKASSLLVPLKYVADSVYLSSKKGVTH